MGTESIRDKSMAALPAKYAVIKDIISKRHAGYKLWVRNNFVIFCSQRNTLKGKWFEKQPIESENQVGLFDSPERFNEG